MKDKYIRRVYTYDTKACYNQQDRSDCWKSHQINIRGVPFKISEKGKGTDQPVKVIGCELDVNCL